MSSNNDQARPKYACGSCGSVELRSDLDTYQVFLAEGDKLIHLRSEFSASGLVELYCNQCHAEIEADDLGEIEIE